MSSTPPRHVALTTEFESYMKAEVITGRYSTSGEVAHSSLRLMIARNEARLDGEPCRG
ncbi:type II toxin-antitoxin system ParD family antitoxin [Sphingomonas sp. BT553]|uniref:Type II toxin-antitoxin system ParD family antitoxin n=1 Tax=Sphingomonas mollis TaxID=2795726 RepID=A0ABS0XTZ6_9SPHN|nr:type II toxin-antitoxin system ParD family antitoxin [Sphingomonas sp. BT553]